MNQPTSAKTKTDDEKSFLAIDRQLQIHFIKSSHFRVIHGSGVWYGGDAQRNLHLTFYSERNPIPKQLVINLNKSGLMVSEDESKRDTREGVVREMEVDVILSLEAATELHRTLGANLEALRLGSAPGH